MNLNLCTYCHVLKTENTFAVYTIFIPDELATSVTSVVSKFFYIDFLSPNSNKHYIQYTV